MDSLLAEYLAEGVYGPFSEFWVPDLVPDGRQSVELVLVFESPHTTELATKVPVTGSTGKRALRFLHPATSYPDSLGALIKEKHQSGDFRIAVLNASRVPLQREAYVSTVSPGLAENQWRNLATIRNHLARPSNLTANPLAGTATARLRSNLAQRVGAMNTSGSCVLVPFGEAARTVTSEVSGLQVVSEKVPHPASPRWSKSVRDGDHALEFVRQYFCGAFD